MAGAFAAIPTGKPRPRRGFVVFKWSVYALLAANVWLYARHGTVNETLDTAAWVLLLLLFEWETGGWSMSGMQRRMAHALRTMAAVAVVWACAGYGLAREWLDFANAATWLGVVLVLELELRIPAARAGFHHLRRQFAAVLYAALAAFAMAWLVSGIAGGEPSAWLDAWDALLWLLAFAVIELNVFGLDPRGSAR